MIGEPEKQFTVLLDTVTTLFWVASPNQLQPFCVNKQTYSCRESSTCTTTRLGFLRQCYGRRIVIVSEYRDNISVVSLSGIRVNFANSSFGALGFLNWPEQEDYQQIDGVFGLSKLHFPDESFKEPLRSSALSERAPDNPVKSTLRKYQLPPFITIALPPLEYGEPAVLTLGGHNNRLCNLHREVTEPLRYNFLHAVANDQSRNRYEFEYKSIKMGNVSFSTQSMPAFAYPHAIKPYIGVPNEFLNAVVQNHNAKLDPTTQKYMVDCREAFEPFEIHTENSAYVVESRHFIIRHDVRYCLHD
ncbi:unnamed protein product [Litomosoides sigmodontis]|uniref:Peptidase A1 domain-containing protein n=1 Tax=Litomosoides sigmodontis TaxID=42156 RepID=A0A3P7LYS0_LITSI|nr:unnamed protein product [Litomosoides sigmodontis]